MKTLLTPLFLLGLWRGEFVTGQNFNCASFGELRLYGAGYFVSMAGRVEICSCNLPGVDGCQWVTIPVSTELVSWGWKNAQVVCRQIYPQDYGVVSPILQDTFSADIPVSTQQFAFSYTFACDGSEENLLNCAMESASGRALSRGAHIQCRTKAPEPLSFIVRLTGFSTDDAVGMVEFYSLNEGGWVTGCAEAWDTSDANVTCVTLGYDSGAEAIYTAGSNTPPSGYFDFNCLGTEPGLSRCGYAEGRTCSNPTFRAGVVCSRSELVDGSVRLFPSQPEEDYNQRAEVLYDGHWGSICDFNWDVDDGRVVCNALGGGNPEIEPFPIFLTDNEVRPIWLTFVECDGSESSLLECLSPYPVGYAPSCFHTSNDAALSCNPAGGLSEGEIAGIVIGCLAFLIIAGSLIRVIEMNVRKYIQKRAQERQRQQRQQQQQQLLQHRLQQRRQQHRALAATVAVVTARTSRAETANNANTTEWTSSNADNPSTLLRVESDTELMRGAPPSYDEAIHLSRAFPGERTNFPNASTSDQSPEGSPPSYPVAGGVTSQSTSDGTSNLPYPSTSSSSAVPYPPADNTGLLPYPHADVASAPHPPPSNVQVPYPLTVPTVPVPSDIQDHPPPSNLGYPPPTNPLFSPEPLASVESPLQLFNDPGNDTYQPVQDVNAPPPPVLQSYEEQQANL